MQSHSSCSSLGCGNNTNVTDGEPIDIDQRSIRNVESSSPFEHAESIENHTRSHATTSAHHTLYSNQMGQGASTPRDEAARNRVSRAREASGGGSGGGDGQLQGSGDGEDRAAAVARARRSRRIRNHMEHLASRLMPRMSGSSSAAPASSAARSRVSGLRFHRSRVRFSRSRSPSPPRRSEPLSQQRHRSMPPLSTARPAPILPDYGLDDMMDISPVSTVTPQTQSQSQPPVPATPAGSRRSRLSRMRDSIGSLSGLMTSELNSMLNRPNARRASETRAGALEALTGGTRRTSTMDATMDTESTRTPSEEPSRPERPSLFGNGQSLLDNLQNPSRIRPGEDQAAMLSRLLSVAAAATAASLVGNAEEAITQAQDVGGDNGGDGSFESFLRALQNGRLEAALRNGGNEMGGGSSSPNDGGDGVLSLNFFRMFRFGSTPANNDGDGEESTPGSRMVPVIIVGIRSVSPRESAEGGEGARPAPFFDALANLPVSIPSVHRRSRLGSANGPHRRTASMGSPMSPMRPTSSTSLNTDLPQGSNENGARDRNSTAGPSRPSNPNEGTRSWIIYVLGGSYPENHPILTTPSLFTDEPTYEDMTLLSSLLGPAKLPVAAKEDLESAGGIFTFGEGSAAQYGPGNADRCLICLVDYETGNECRKLVKCNHIFHKECIDEWLTTGRNSCPLCRGEGVEEKSKASDRTTPAETESTAAPAAAAAH